MQAHMADVIYATPRSRVADNFLRTAYSSCMKATLTKHLDVFPVSHKYAHDKNYGISCSCVREAPSFWWQTRTKPRDLYAGCNCTHVPSEAAVSLY